MVPGLYGKCVSVRLWPLGGDPGVAEAFGSSSSFLGDQVQHGQKEAGKALSFLPLPVVLLHQDIQEPPRLQLTDVPQVTWGRRTRHTHKRKGDITKPSPQARE